MRWQNFFRNHKTLIVSVGFLTVFSFAVTYATPPGSPYSAGATLDPNCAPGSSNCTVNISGGGSQWDTVTGGINYAGGKVGIGTTTPQTALDIEGDGAIIAAGAFSSGVAVPDLGSGVRLEWIPSAVAFRAGFATGTEWDSANVGLGSIGLGVGVTASGISSFAAGQNTIASGQISTAFGEEGTASGNFSTAFGNGSIASGSGATTWGGFTVAGGDYATAFGDQTIADALESTAIGSLNVGGGNPQAWIGTDPLFEIGNGQNSTRSDALLVLKNGNTTINGDLNVTGNVTCGSGCGGGGGSSQWDNVTGGINYAGGLVGIGTTTPAAALDLEGDGTLLAVGTFGSGAAVPDLGAGTRLMWIPSKGAFRAGTASGTNWNDSNVGTNSVAFGTGSTASGDQSFATGFAQATATYATAFGTATASASNSVAFISGTAQGANSFAILGSTTGTGSFAQGNGSGATGTNSVAFAGANVSGTRGFAAGSGSGASGTDSAGFAGGISTGNNAFSANGANAAAFGSAAFGIGNIAGGNATTWIPTDPLFEIGIGSDNVSGHDAVMVLKNGNVGIGTGTPALGTLLQVSQPTTGAGTVSVNNGSKNIVGDGTAFTNNFIVGDTITIAGVTRIIQTITDDTHMATTVNWNSTAANASPANYSVPGGDFVTVKNHGFVGIKNTSPTFILDVGSSAVTTGTAVAEFQNAGGTCDITPSVSGGITCSSDMNLKKNITNLADNSSWSFNNNISTANNSVLQDILALNPVNYNWDAEQDTDAKHTGFIAQEVQQVFPDLVQENPTTHFLSLNYTGLLPYTIEAIKEMNFNITSIDDLTKANTWRDSLNNWFADTKNGIGDFVANNLKANNEVCIQDVCLTKADFQRVIQERQQQASVSGGTPSDSSQTPEVGPQSPDTNEPVVTDSTSSPQATPDNTDQTQSQETSDPAPTTPSDQTQSPD